MAGNTNKDIQESLARAVEIRHRETEAYEAALASHDPAALLAHHEAGKKAAEVATTALSALEKAILSTEAATNALKMLAAANKEMSDSADALGKMAKSLEKFTAAANVVAHLLEVATGL